MTNKPKLKKSTKIKFPVLHSSNERLEEIIIKNETREAKKKKGRNENDESAIEQPGAKKSKKERIPNENSEHNSNCVVGEPLLPHSQGGIDKRTIFIGNLPVNFKKKKILKLLKQFGQVENIRTRGAIPWIAKLTKKAAIHKHNKLPEEHPPLMVYASFKTSIEARNALNLNGEMYENHRLRVTFSKEKKINVNEGVFVGNLPFNVKEDDLYQLFEQCGGIAGVRLVRDSQTGVGKGFGYVHFKSSDSVELALQLRDEKLNGREIRVQRLYSEGKKKKMDRKKRATLLKLTAKNEISRTARKSGVKVCMKTFATTDKKSRKRSKLNAINQKKKHLAEKLTSNLGKRH